MHIDLELSRFIPYLPYFVSAAIVLYGCRYLYKTFAAAGDHEVAKALRTFTRFAWAILLMAVVGFFVIGQLVNEAPRSQEDRSSADQDAQNFERKVNHP